MLQAQSTNTPTCRSCCRHGDVHHYNSPQYHCVVQTLQLRLHGLPVGINSMSDQHHKHGTKQEARKSSGLPNGILLVWFGTLLAAQTHGMRSERCIDASNGSTRRWIVTVHPLYWTLVNRHTQGPSEGSTRRQDPIEQIMIQHAMAYSVLSLPISPCLCMPLAVVERRLTYAKSLKRNPVQGWHISQGC